MSKLSVRRLLLILFVAAATSCVGPGGDAAEADVPGARADGFGDPEAGSSCADPGMEPGLSLLQPGEETRQTLRYDFQGAEPQQIAVEAVVHHVLDGSDVDVAPTTLRLVLDLRPAGLTAGGDLQLDLSVASASVTGAPVEGGALAEALEHVRGLSASLEISPRGLLVSHEVRLPDERAQGPLVSVLDSLFEQSLQLAMPLPEEEVGVGAEWRTVAGTLQEGIELRGETVHTLRGLAADRIELDIVQSFDLCELGVPVSTQGEVTVSLARLSGYGVGGASQPLGRPAGCSRLHQRLAYEYEYRRDGELVGDSRLTVATTMTMADRSLGCDLSWVPEEAP